MRKALAVAAATAILAVPTAAVAVPSAVAPKATRYTLCDFDRYGTPSNRYPYNFMITTRYQYTSNSRIRSSVRSIQQFLRSSGYTNRVGGPTQVDGKYGPATAYAVKQFQRRLGLVVDGKVGRQTWNAMTDEYCYWF